MIYRVSESLFEDKMVALGPPKDILSHALISAIGAVAIGNPSEELRLGLHSSRGAFIYEIPNPNIRLYLYNLGLIETTILPPSQFARALHVNPKLNYVSFNITSTPNPVTYTYNKTHDGRTRKNFTIGTPEILDYMNKHFDITDARGALCR